MDRQIKSLVSVPFYSILSLLEVDDIHWFSFIICSLKSFILQDPLDLWVHMVHCTITVLLYHHMLSHGKTFCLLLQWAWGFSLLRTQNAAMQCESLIISLLNDYYFLVSNHFVRIANIINLLCNSSIPLPLEPSLKD